MNRFSKYEIDFLINNYPIYGKTYCCDKLNRTEGSIRRKTSNLGLKLNNKSDFFKDFQERARLSKIGKKRPAQAEIMKKNHREGKMIMSENRKRNIGIRIKKYIKENGHPRGFLGHHHGLEAKKIISNNTKEYYAGLNDYEKKKIKDKMVKTKLNNGTYLNGFKSENAFSRTKSGKRLDLDNTFFRSGTEANFARFLKFTKIKYEFEKYEFEFKGINRGVRFYIPDFYIPEKDIFYEVKGWLDNKSKIKLKRFKKYHPIEFSKLIIVKQSLRKKDMAELLRIGFNIQNIIDFKDIEKLKLVIPYWE